MFKRTVVFAVFCMTLFYCIIQYLGLVAHRDELISVEDVIGQTRDVVRSRDDPTSQSFGWFHRIAHALTGREPALQSELTGRLQRVCHLPDRESDTVKLCQDTVGDFGIQLVGDLYVLNFGIWVLPILGFIGTVWGISRSVIGLRELVAGASSNQQLINDLPASMDTVLSGLSTAFDTTFLGLIFAALLMLPNMLLRRMVDLQLMHDYKMLLGCLPIQTYTETDQLENRAA
jgi:biopolymer transport protein ExbB/TolQ